MPDESLDATADSSTADTVQQQGTSAGTQNTDQPPAKEPPFHLHPRWQELQGRLKNQDTALATANQRAEQLAERLRQFETAAKPGAQPSEEYVAAAQALLKVMESDPRLKTLLSLSDAAPHLMRGYQGIQRLSEAQQRTLMTQGRSRVNEAAAKAGLPTDERALQHIEEMVAGAIRRNQGLAQRFKEGDMSAVDEAFKDIEEGLLQVMRRAAGQDLKQTKDMTKRLPPVPTGGSPGKEAPPKLEEGKEREFERTMHDSAIKRLESLLRG